MRQGRWGAWSVLATRAFRETLGPGPFGLLLLGALLVATLPGAKAGGPGATVWGLGALAAATALLAGMGPAFTGLHRSAWLQVQPPGPLGRCGAIALGVWLACGALLLPALFLPLPAWTGHAGDFHSPLPIRSLTFSPGPPGYLLRPGAELLVETDGTAPLTGIALVALPRPGPDGTLEPTTLAYALDGGPWRRGCTVTMEAGRKSIPIEPPRPVRRLALRREDRPGLGLWIRPGDLILLGPARPAGPVWFWAWLGAWHLAGAAGLLLGGLGSLLSRPVALLVGLAWFLLALADPAFRLDLPPAEVGRGLACGADLARGRGWLPLGAAFVAACLLARRPDLTGGGDR